MASGVWLLGGRLVLLVVVIFVGARGARRMRAHDRGIYHVRGWVVPGMVRRLLLLLAAGVGGGIEVGHGGKTGGIELELSW